MKTLFVFIVGFAAGLAAAAAMLLWRGVGTHEPPTPIEIEVARSMRRFSMSSAERARRNPILVDPEVLAEGRAHFADHCASCHANDGSGETELGRNLYPRAPDMRLLPTQNLSDGELFSIIRDGVRLTGMPGWGGSNDDNWRLVLFIRHLPNLKPEEIEIMKRLNPKTAEERERQRRESEFLKGH